MPEKVGFLKKLNGSKKMQCVFFFVSMVALVGAYFPTLQFVKNNRIEEAINNQDIVIDRNVILNIDDVNVQNNQIILNGWIFRLKSQNIDLRLVLSATDETSVFITGARFVENSKVKEYFELGNEYNNCGFEATIPIKKVEENICYEIILALNYDENNQRTSEGESTVKISTKKYLYNGMLYSYDPTIYSVPSIIDTEMQNVFKEGEVLAYSLEKGAWVYLWENKIYWVLAKDLFGSKKENPEIPLFAYTWVPMTNEMPGYLERVYEGYYLSEEDLITQQNAENYFVYSKDISGSNVIAYIDTGAYRNAGEHPGWIWEGICQPSIDIY